MIYMQLQYITVIYMPTIHNNQQFGFQKIHENPRFQ